MTDIVWKTTVLPDATAGVYYEAGLAETGSATAINGCSVSNGTLPPGLSILAGHIQVGGTPSGAGIGKTYSFNLTLSDTAGGVIAGPFTITVRAAADVAGRDKPFSSLPVVAQMASMWPAQF
jgi:hypothetical protein